MHFIIELLIFVGILYFIKKYEEHVEKIEALEKHLKWTESRVELLRQFVCESPLLAEDAKSFIARGFNCGHDLFAGDHKICICMNLQGRTNSLVDRNEFYEQLNAAKNEMDGHDLHWEDEDKKHAKENQQAILPYLKKLNKIAPNSVTDEHIKWLMRDGLHDAQIARYLGWFLPSLQDGFNAIKDPEGIKILNEFIGRLGGNPGKLSDALMFVLKPLQEK